MKKALIIIGLFFCQAFAVSPFTWFWNINLTGDTATVVKWKANNDSVLNWSSRISDTVTNAVPHLSKKNIFTAVDSFAVGLQGKINADTVAARAFGAVVSDSLNVHGTVIQKNGKIGVGSAATLGQIQIKQSANTVTNGFVITNNAVNHASYFWDDSLTARLDAGGDGSGVISINGTGTGSFGVGTTTPTLGRLQLKQSADAAGNGIAILNSSANQAMRFWVSTGGTGVSNINGATDAGGIIALNGAGVGNVGIHNVSPTRGTLDVSGGIAADSIIPTSYTTVCSLFEDGGTYKSNVTCTYVNYGPFTTMTIPTLTSSSVNNGVALHFSSPVIMDSIGYVSCLVRNSSALTTGYILHSTGRIFLAYVYPATEAGGGISGMPNQAITFKHN
jgi:hypothetical protein